MQPGTAANAPEPAQVIPASLADLLERPLYAHLATVRPDGTPQVNPTWFRFDGVYLWLTTTTRRQKNRNWQIQPAVALSITDPDRPSRYLEVRGRVERIIPDPEGAEFVRLAERYGVPQGCRVDPAEVGLAVELRQRVEERRGRGAGLQGSGDVMVLIVARYRAGQVPWQGRPAAIESQR